MFQFIIYAILELLKNSIKDIIKKTSVKTFLKLFLQYMIRRLQLHVGLTKENKYIVPSTSEQVFIKIKKPILQTAKPENWIFKDEHFKYEIELNVGNDYWTIYRRFSDIRKEHNRLLEKATFREDLRNIEFPPLALFTKHTDFQRKRIKELEIYLRKMVSLAMYENKMTNYSKDSFCQYLRFFESNVEDEEYKSQLKMTWKSKLESLCILLNNIFK